MLKNLNLALQRLRLSYKATSKFMLKSYNFQMNQLSERKSHLGLEQLWKFKIIDKEQLYRNKEFTLFEFLGEEDILYWDVETDYRVGANSRALISYVGNERKDYLSIIRRRVDSP